MTATNSSIQEYGRFIELPVQKKLLSVLEGRHGGIGAGSSHEFLDMAEYKAGDDIADIDWKSTARMGQPIVKRFEQRAVLSVILAVDTGSNMSALAAVGPGEPATQRKFEVAEALVTSLAWLTANRADHLGLVAGDSSNLVTYPARSGVSHAQTLLRVVSRTSPLGAAGDMNAVLRRVGTVRRNKALIVGITDIGQLDRVNDLQLKRLTHKHEVVFFIVEDLDPTITDVTSEMIDVASGPLPDFASTSGAVEYQWKVSTRDQRLRVANRMRDHGISWSPIRSSGEVAAALLAVFGGGRSGTNVA